MRRLALFALLFLHGTYGTDPNGKAPVRSLIQSLRARAESMQHEGALHVTPLASVRNPKRGDASAHWSRFAGAQLELERDAGSTAARLRAVDALVSYMRVLSDGNALTIAKGGKIELSDTAANRKLWSTHAQAALGLLGPLLVDGAAEKDPMLAAMHAEALTYKESARGVIKSATSGGAISFLSSTNRLYDRHRRYDSAVSCIFRGAYYLAAPWPLGSVKKGRRFFDEAHRAFPDSRRNRYYAAVGAWADGDVGAARALFEATLAARSSPLDKSERDIEAFLIRAANDGLKTVATAEAPR